MKYYLIAGEASGDLHGSNLMKELKKVDTSADFCFFGGDMMQAQGGKLVKHYRELAFMGFVEVLANIRTISRNFDLCKSEILKFAPDVIILIDYAGFNLRIAEFAKASGIKVYYYISPKIWAWNQSRAKKIKAYVDKMFVIFPFEIDFYKKLDYPVEFVGNPLLDALEPHLAEKDSFEKFISENGLSTKPIVGLLAGSRKQEIKRMLPVMIEASKKYTKDFQFVIAGAPGVEPEFYKALMKDTQIPILFGKTYPILQHAHTAMVTSGTATLETALFAVPEVVCYRIQGGKLVWDLFRRFIKVKWVSLVNLVMNREVILELLQHKFDVPNLQLELDKLLFNDEYRQKMKENYAALRKIMGGSGASARSARIIYDSLK
jgi:lipid-A-disaccharide synthase